MKTLKFIVAGLVVAILLSAGVLLAQPAEAASPEPEAYWSCRLTYFMIGWWGGVIVIGPIYFCTN